VNLRVTKMDIQHLILWADRARRQAGEVDVPFEPDELELLRKLYTARDLAFNYSPEVTAEWQADLAQAPLGMLARAGLGGRPRKVTPLVEYRIALMRRSGLLWREIGKLTDLPAGTCRKVKVTPQPAEEGCGKLPCGV